MDPPISEPSSNDVIPLANAAAEPPDDPPGVLSRSQGLFVVPKISLKLCVSAERYGTFVLPNIIAPSLTRF